jgi:outer membrane protein with beta-barrel domain
MKKTLVVPLMLIASLAFGQLSLGLKAGVNISNFSGKDIENVKKSALVGFHAGGLVHLGLGKHFVLQPELLFSTQGAKLSAGGTETDFKIGYINIPVMLQYEAEGGFYVEAGPQFGFKASENLPDSIKDFAKSSDLSVGLGLGFHSKGGFGIGGRYVVGLSKVSDFDINNVTPDYKNAVLQFSLFYTFFNKGKKEKEKEIQ